MPAMATDTSLPPLINAQLKHLLANFTPPIKVDQIWSGSKDARFSDRFTLLIPFCLDYIQWDVIYNALHPLDAPDIIFSPEDEGFHPLAANERSTLSDWNGRDPARLLNLVHEIRDVYRRYQVKLVEKLDDPRLKFEIETISARKGIEVCMMSGPDKPEEVKFAIPLLDINLNKLVPWYPWKKDQQSYLQVVFPVSRKYSSAPPRLKLVCSSELKTLFSIKDDTLPPWPDEMCMAEYLPKLEENVNDQLSQVVKSVDARRHFIEALAPVFGRPLEADPVFCRRATILSASGTFGFLVHFSLPTQFPDQKPILTLQSCQHFNSPGTPVTSPPISDYGWSPRWSPEEMAQRIFESLVKECLNFKKYCNDTIAQQP